VTADRGDARLNTKPRRRSLDDDPGDEYRGAAPQWRMRPIGYTDRTVALGSLTPRSLRRSGSE
jgi:hypothetical protein